jgi:hypothetical protein
MRCSPVFIVMPSTGSETIAYCVAQRKSRAGITPHGLPHDCRFRGSAALFYHQSLKAEMVACELRQSWNATASWARGQVEGMAMRERGR